MKIHYPTLSKFLKACEEAIRQNKMALLAGIPISVKLSSLGYNGKILVEIKKTDPATFSAKWGCSDSTRFPIRKWGCSDSTRFPIRIKAAAYALFKQGYFGKFVITHDRGNLTIQYLTPPNSHNVKQISDISEIVRNGKVNNKSAYKTVSTSREYLLESDIDKGIAVAEILYSRFYKSNGGIFGRRDMPEDVLPETVEKGSYEHLMFITLTVSIDYQRDAPELWRVSRQTINDKDTRWVYSPKEVLKKSDNELIDALQKYNLSKKPIKDSLKIWKPVSKSLYDLFESDPKKLLEECNYDALKVFESMRSRYKRYFPYLSGKKILPLWIRMMHDVVGIELENLEKIPIPVDIHVARATFCVGGLKGKYVGSIEDVFSKIDEVWKKACEHFPYYRLQLDEPLWHLSKYGCRNRRGDYCPKSIVCPVQQYCVPGRIYITTNKVEIDT